MLDALFDVLQPGLALQGVGVGDDPQDDPLDFGPTKVWRQAPSLDGLQRVTKQCRLAL